MTEETNNADSLMQFPCDFPIKIMGQANESFTQELVAVVLRHAPDFDPATVEMRTSSARRFISITVTIRAQSREQLDNLYREITAHPLVTMAL